jgi:uroporphyrinogen-III synthase
MRQQKNILITRPLSFRQRKYANDLGLNVIEKPALKFKFPDHWEAVLKNANNNPGSGWVFTSRNGVKALEKLMNEGLEARINTQCFAVGAKTQSALKKLGLEAKIPTRQDGKHLAQFIIEEGSVDSVIYFHGNLSRSEMANTLVKNNIEVIETEVYQTKIQSVELPTEPVDAILFYSPSAVEGFKRGQGFGEPLPQLFAIGPATAKVLEKKSGQSVKFAAKPDTKILLQTVSNFLFNKNCQYIYDTDRTDAR